MRPKERIIPFLEFIEGNFNKLFVNIWKFPKDEPIEGYIANIKLFEERISEYWMENPDLRYSQVLVNLGIIPNIPGFWYYIEEDEILKQLTNEKTNL